MALRYTGITTSFNEMQQAYEGIYSYTPKIWQAFEGQLLGISGDKATEVYQFNDEDVPNEFFGELPAEGYIMIVAGEEHQKVFTNVEFNSAATSPVTNPKEIPLLTVDHMQLENSYTKSGKIELGQGSLRRRFRTWRIQLPKDDNGVRYLDTYLKLTLFNTPSQQANLRLEDISIYYLLPIL